MLSIRLFDRKRTLRRRGRHCSALTELGAVRDNFIYDERGLEFCNEICKQFSLLLFSVLLSTKGRITKGGNKFSHVPKPKSCRKRKKCFFLRTIGSSILFFLSGIYLCRQKLFSMYISYLDLWNYHTDFIEKYTNILGVNADIIVYKKYMIRDSIHLRQIRPIDST